MSENDPKESKSQWIFGYGSLTWKADFPFRRKVPGYVRGYKRLFYQGSHDHRGTPDAPGRVVTLLEDPEGVVWGFAYQIAAHDVEGVMEHLDFREKNGYKTTALNFHPKDGSNESILVTVYVATPSNEFYLGPAPLPEIARQIVSSQGPSGKNTEYLFNLARVMKELGPECVDEHLSELETLATRYLKNQTSNYCGT